MSSSNFNLLDCTLRDGGYYNNWNFSKKIIQKYISDINSTGIKYIELGFRFNENRKIKGLTAYTEYSLLNSLKIPKDVTIGIMINISDLIKDNKLEIKELKKLVSKKNISKIKFVRFACHFKEIFFLNDCINYLNKLKLKVFINIMQISEIEITQINKISKFLKTKNIEAIYFADSLGALKPRHLEKIILQFKKKCNHSFGIHAHDNLKLALKNSLIAKKLGASWIDSTVTGMGRGPGNLKTEEILKKLDNYKFTKKFKNTMSTFVKMRKNYKWGPNKYYKYAALAKIHPTYIQQMLSDKRYKKEEYKEIMSSLAKSDTKKFNPYKLINYNYFLTDKLNGSWRPIKILKNKNVIILGPGKNLTKNKNQIERLIVKYNYYVIALNTIRTINEKFVDLRVLCHPLRIMSEISKLAKVNYPLVLPYSSLRKSIKNVIKSKKNILDFGLNLKRSNQVTIGKNCCSLPYPLTIGYAISIALSGKAKNIHLAGFDGYNKSDADHDNTEDVLQLLIKNSFKNKIISLTKTKFKYLRYINH
ncbi:hypothetical protein N9T21_00545 [Candidatus Pelagibacter sp.]|nr:hypothetical protein [Candidatus Pelagibacter sp.]